MKNLFINILDEAKILKIHLANRKGVIPTVDEIQNYSKKIFLLHNQFFPPLKLRNWLQLIEKTLGFPVEKTFSVQKSTGRGIKPAVHVQFSEVFSTNMFQILGFLKKITREKTPVWLPQMNNNADKTITLIDLITNKYIS